MNDIIDSAKIDADPRVKAAQYKITIAAKRVSEIEKLEKEAWKAWQAAHDNYSEVRRTVREELPNRYS